MKSGLKALQYAATSKKQKEITTINVVDRLNPDQQKTLFRKSSRPSMHLEQNQ